MKEVIMKVPSFSADYPKAPIYVAELIRCKECRHRPIKEDVDGENYGFNIIAPEGSSLCPCLVDDGWYSWMPKDNFFCGYGESKESE